MTQTTTSMPYPPGTRVRVIRQVPRQAQMLASSCDGMVVKHQMRKTGSWFAHGKDDKLWLDRLTVKKADGEEVMFILDANTRVEVLSPAQDGQS